MREDVSASAQLSIVANVIDISQSRVAGFIVAGFTAAGFTAAGFTAAGFIVAGFTFLLSISFVEFKIQKLHLIITSQKVSLCNNFYL